MSTITYSPTTEEIQKLRNHTSAGMMDCKKALVSTNGNFEDAIAFLRMKGQKLISGDIRENDFKEGFIFCAVSSDYHTGVMIELNCETDFVSRTTDFKQLGTKIANAVLNDLPSTLQDVYNLQIGSVSVHEMILSEISKVGEKIQISKFEIVKGDYVISYIHQDGKTGVLVDIKNISISNLNDVGKNIAMQIAAMAPQCIDITEIPAEKIQRELDMYTAQAMSDGKPEILAKKIAQGKLQKFYGEYALLYQDYIKDTSLKVKDYLLSVHKDFAITAFKFFKLG